MKKLLINLARFLISFGILGGLIYWIKPARLLENFSNVDPVLLLLAIGTFVVIVSLMTLRWLVLLRSQNQSPGYFKLFALYFIGYFFNNFLPTAIGGDVSRAYYAGRAIDNMPLSIGTVFFERILGVLATLTLATIAMLWMFNELDNILILMTLLMFTMVTVCLAMLLNPTLFGFVQRFFSRISLMNIGEKLNKILETVHFYRNAKQAVLFGYLISVTFQLLFVLMNALLAISLGLTAVTFGQLLIVIPVTFVMGLLPSLNGLGVRESGYLLLLSKVFESASVDEAVALSLLNTSIPVLVSLAGGVMLLFYRNSAVSAQSPGSDKPS